MNQETSIGFNQWLCRWIPGICQSSKDYQCVQAHTLPNETQRFLPSYTTKIDMIAGRYLKKIETNDTALNQKCMELYNSGAITAQEYRLLTGEYLCFGYSSVSEVINFLDRFVREESLYGDLDGADHLAQIQATLCGLERLTIEQIEKLPEDIRYIFSYRDMLIELDADDEIINSLSGVAKALQGVLHLLTNVQKGVRPSYRDLSSYLQDC